MFPRLLLLLSLLLPQLVLADTTAAITAYHYGNPLDANSSHIAACQAQAQRVYVSSGLSSDYTIEATLTGGDLCRIRSIYQPWLPNSWAYTVLYEGIQPTPVSACPAGQNWTLQGSNCVRPDCTAGQVRDPNNGQCIAAPCETNSPTTFSGNAGWAVCAKNDLSCVVGGNAGQYVMPSSICDGQCTVTVSGVQSGSCSNPSGAAADTPKPITCIFTGMKTGGTCSQSTIPEAGAPPQVVKKAPPCDANQGVMTSSSGTVACVSEGTPSSNKPIVSRKSNTQTFPDGSTMTTETTVTRDPATGAEVTSEKITRTPATGGGTGAAGTPGTSDGPTTSKAPTIGGGTSGNDPINNDLCAKNPGLQICKGGMNEEATQKKVLEELQKLTNPGDTNYDAVKNAKETDASKEANDTENNKFKDAASGAFDPIASNRSAWQQAMDAPWFGAIPASGCQPFTGTIGNRSFVIDHCPTAQKISVIAEYAMWFGVVVGIFVMFTGGRAQGV